MARALFVIGLARSGTNLLARMLDRHSRIAVALDPLMPVFRSLRNAIVQASVRDDVRRRFRPDSAFQDFYFDPDGLAVLDALLAADANLPVAPAELERLRGAVRERAALESPELAGRLSGLEGSTYQELLRCALDIIRAGKADAQWVGCKEVWIFDFIPLLARTFPDARIYAIERDPRAIVASLLAMAERDPTQAAHPPSYLRHWRKSIALARHFSADPTLASRFRAMAYEHLVANAEQEARRICGELSVAFESDMLSLSAEGWTGNSSYADGKDVYASSIERWRDKLPRDAWQAADFLCGPEMRLTRYRDEKPGAPDQVREYLERADRLEGSWRSGSGHAAQDMERELHRTALLAGESGVTADVIRMNYLFTDIFEAIRRAPHR